ncbi:hypothetical protein LP420_35730 [Massilia sp. B-10]|nr:hypothetical protein LP420_35730 [Massilia sp. B-10]
MAHAVAPALLGAVELGVGARSGPTSRSRPPVAGWPGRLLTVAPPARPSRAALLRWKWARTRSATISASG